MSLSFWQKISGLVEEFDGFKLGDTVHVVGVHKPYKLDKETFYRFELALFEGRIIQISRGNDHEFLVRCDKVHAGIQGNFETKTGKNSFYVEKCNYGAVAKDLHTNNETALQAFKVVGLQIQNFFEAVTQAQPDNQISTIKLALASLPL